MPENILSVQMFYLHESHYVLFLCTYLQETQKATLYWDATQKTVHVRHGVMDTSGDAYGYFNDSLSSTGWSVLEIRAGYGRTTQSDAVTYFLAGYLEGYLTAQ